jgi:hypothetical protein
MKRSIIKLGLFIILVALSGQILVNLNAISLSLGGVAISDTHTDFEIRETIQKKTSYGVRKSFTTLNLKRLCI